MTTVTTLSNLMVWFDGRCRYCGILVMEYYNPSEHYRLATREHLTPKSRGGGDAVDNVGLSCRRCNGLKADMTDGEFKHLVLEGLFHPGYVRWILSRKMERLGRRRPTMIAHLQKDSA